MKQEEEEPIDILHTIYEYMWIHNHKLMSFSIQGTCPNCDIFFDYVICSCGFFLNFLDIDQYFISLSTDI
jgi:hypothetical protein